MKTISIKQPWASLIVHGIKDIENRTWPCPKKYIGQRVLIHASKRKRLVEATSIFTQAQFDVIRSDERFIRGSHTNPQVIDSAIIGSVEIVDCVQNHPSVWAEKSMENKCPNCGREIKNHFKEDSFFCEHCDRKCVRGTDYDVPIYNWVLAKPALYENLITAKGKLSFWDYPGIKEVKIECPECGSIEIAVEDYTTVPFPTFLHCCNKCDHMIIESKWDVVEKGGKP